MGKPAWGHAQAPSAEYIGRREATGGTETSKYPEEEKSIEIPLVVASERGGGQTGGRASPAGVVGLPQCSHKPARERKGLGRPAEQG